MHIVQKDGKMKIKLTFLILFFIILFCRTNGVVYAASQVPTGFTPLLEAPGIQKVPVSGGSTTEISGDYGSMLKLTDNVVYKPTGVYKTLNDTPGSKHPLVYQFNPADGDIERSVLVENAGFYNGESIDVKFVIDKMNFKVQTGNKQPSFNFVAVSPAEKNDNGSYYDVKTKEDLYFFSGSAGGYGIGDDVYSYGDTVEYHYEFYKHGETTAFNMKGSWNFSNINVYKSVAFIFDSDFQNMYVKDSNCSIGYKENSPEVGKTEFYGGSEDVGLMESRMTYLYEANHFNLIMKNMNYDDQFPNALNPMGVLYSNESIARIGPSTPLVVGMKNESKHLEDGYKNLQYSIIQSVADNTKENRNTKFALTSEVPNFYDISEVKIYQYGTSDEYTDIFTITVDPTDKNKVTIEAKDPTSDKFNGKVFDIKVVAKANDQFSFDKDLYGYKTVGSDGFMNFDLGESTKTSYEFNSYIKKTLSSSKTTRSVSQVLYEGVPDADPKANVKIPIDTDIETQYTDPGTTFLDNVRVDTDDNTGASVDRKVTVSYKKPLPSTAALGKQTVTLTLTTSKGITKDIPVEVEIVPTTADLRVQYKINGTVDTRYPDYLNSDNMIGDPIDLTTITEVTDMITKIEQDGYKLVKKPTEQFTLATGGNTVEYEFEGILYLYSAPSLLDFGLETASYNDLRVEDVAIDNQLIVADTRAQKKEWVLTAKVTQEFTSADGSKVIPNILRYNNGSNVEVDFPLNQDQTIEKATNADNQLNVSNSWKKGSKGFKLDIPANSVKEVGKYKAKITFTVGNAP
ncbi:WxL domain-containing protein [Enterococcus sp. LJL99]